MTKNKIPLKSESDAELVRRFLENFSNVASLQGRIAYLIMSVHVVNPNFLMTHVSHSSSRIIYFNMIYGIGIMIYARPNMQAIGFLNRAAFSVLGSLMFNYGSMAVFHRIRDTFADCTCPFLATLLSFLTGRVFMLHLLAFLYHIDIRSSRNFPRNSTFDTMYYK